ncbi:hypothetical protein C8Q74DRAFT_388673 [Fomes fomentarius]|nr:hypothetical protein C8Q74DRAFT_388673 [Fomes fomentarius]
MRLLTYVMRMQLIQPEYLHKHPLSVYALACAYGLEGVARAAARASLAHPGQLEYVRELELISTRTYHLLDYRSRCRDAVRATLYWGNDTQPPQWMLAPELRDELKRLLHASGGVAIVQDLPVHTSWVDGMRSVSRDLELRPLPIATFSNELLDHVLSSYESTTAALEYLPSVQEVAALLDKEVQKALDQVELVFDN